MDPFTMVLVVLGALVLLYCAVTFLRPRRGRTISQTAIDSDDALNSARVWHDARTNGPTDTGGAGINGP